MFSLSLVLLYLSLFLLVNLLSFLVSFFENPMFRETPENLDIYLGVMDFLTAALFKYLMSFHY